MSPMCVLEHLACGKPLVVLCKVGTVYKRCEPQSRVLCLQLQQLPGLSCWALATPSTPSAFRKGTIGEHAARRLCQRGFTASQECSNISPPNIVRRLLQLKQLWPPLDFPRLHAGAGITSGIDSTWTFVLGDLQPLFGVVIL